ncbi:hypothetical protein DPM13_01110 [Paracoccus mutanolyticus]|uniref:Uncharacterized protein n=1 Tax=Paracoccus mutanolyticus TaxID=1499308 RepID=A0ABM6WP12_9RHOB|nr:hypothetical protein [Paracoccus mutanolyticus]AWX92339.1 hypothetical protein DPM13_01110 [Paracoccus mutanolyticus]
MLDLRVQPGVRIGGYDEDDDVIAGSKNIGCKDDKEDALGGKSGHALTSGSILDAVLAGKASAVTTTGLEAVRFEHVALPEVSWDGDQFVWVPDTGRPFAGPAAIARQAY